MLEVSFRYFTSFLVAIMCSHIPTKKKFERMRREMVEHGLVLGEVIAQSDAREPRQRLRSGQVVSAPMRSGAPLQVAGHARVRSQDCKRIALSLGERKKTLV